MLEPCAGARTVYDVMTVADDKRRPTKNDLSRLTNEKLPTLSETFIHRPYEFQMTKSAR